MVLIVAIQRGVRLSEYVVIYFSASFELHAGDFIKEKLILLVLHFQKAIAAMHCKQLITFIQSSLLTE